MRLQRADGFQQAITTTAVQPQRISELQHMTVPVLGAALQGGGRHGTRVLSTPRPPLMTRQDWLYADGITQVDLWRPCQTHTTSQLAPRVGTSFPFDFEARVTSASRTVRPL